VSFDVPAESYGRFMGRFSEPLADRFVALADPQPPQRVLDVGCGPGALTSRLVDRLGSGHVVAVDPSAPFVAAVRQRLPGVEVHEAPAEELPLRDDSDDAALAQLVVHFMSDPVRGLAEMLRTTRPGGLVATCVWDHAGGRGPLSLFWDAVHDLDPGAPGESTLAGTRDGHLGELLVAAGADHVTTGRIDVAVPFAGAEEWWEPFTLGVGPAGEYVAGQGERGRAALREACAARLPEGPFELTVTAWTGAGRART
jgi:SAM-dependent methyltransferase